MLWQSLNNVWACKSTRLWLTVSVREQTFRGAVPASGDIFGVGLWVKQREENRQCIRKWTAYTCSRNLLACYRSLCMSRSLPLLELRPWSGCFLAWHRGGKCHCGAYDPLLSRAGTCTSSPDALEGNGVVHECVHKCSYPWAQRQGQVCQLADRKEPHTIWWCCDEVKAFARLEFREDYSLDQWNRSGWCTIRQLCKARKRQQSWTCGCLSMTYFFMHLMARYLPFLILCAFRTSLKVPSPFLEISLYLCIAAQNDFSVFFSLFLFLPYPLPFCLFVD